MSEQENREPIYSHGTFAAEGAITDFSLNRDIIEVSLKGYVIFGPVHKSHALTLISALATLGVDAKIYQFNDDIVVSVKSQEETKALIDLGAHKVTW